MICDWDEVPWAPHELGELRFERQSLSEAVGSARISLCRYPDSQKIAFRGLKLIARVQPLDYWDGEQ